MFDKLEDLVRRFEEITNELTEPSVVNDQNRFRKLMKEQSDLQPLVDAYTEYRKCQETVEDSLAMLESESDDEMREMLKEEMSDAKKRIIELEQEMKILLLPKDPNDEKNVIVEIRAGAGGDEAALFAAEVYRMYVHYAESKRWKTEIVECDEIGIGGMKSVTFMINGQGAYSMMKYESGVHRVQRVPETESGGRIHTSTISGPLCRKLMKILISRSRTKISVSTLCASGNGGQCQHHRLRSASDALPDWNRGIQPDREITAQNKAKAFALLRAKLYDIEQQRDMMRRQRCAAARSVPETVPRRSVPTTSRRDVTDHRINLTLYKLDKIMNGDIQEIIDAVSQPIRQRSWQYERLRSSLSDDLIKIY